jgi:hypothetical protein
MSTSIRREEYSTLGDFLLTSFVRDQPTIMLRYPKLNSDYLKDFISKIDFIKQLESSLVLTEAQKEITTSLYQESTTLYEELSFLKTYLQDAKLNTTTVAELKTDLHKHNIEGAIKKIEDLKQYLDANNEKLVEQGMQASFTATLVAHKTSLTHKNNAQNEFMNNRKQLTDKNGSHYDALYECIKEINKKGKLVFKNTITADEYTLKNNIARMRVIKQTPKKQ